MAFPALQLSALYTGTVYGYPDQQTSRQNLALTAPWYVQLKLGRKEETWAGWARDEGTQGQASSVVLTQESTGHQKSVGLHRRVLAHRDFKRKRMSL